jgi:hypothetical protein
MAVRFSPLRIGAMHRSFKARGTGITRQQLVPGAAMIWGTVKLYASSATLGRERSASALLPFYAFYDGD